MADPKHLAHLVEEARRRGRGQLAEGGPQHGSVQESKGGARPFQARQRVPFRVDDVVEEAVDFRQGLSPKPGTEWTLRAQA